VYATGRGPRGRSWSRVRWRWAGWRTTAAPCRSSGRGRSCCSSGRDDPPPPSLAHARGLGRHGRVRGVGGIGAPGPAAVHRAAHRHRLGYAPAGRSRPAARGRRADLERRRPRGGRRYDRARRCGGQRDAQRTDRGDREGTAVRGDPSGYPLERWRRAVRGGGHRDREQHRRYAACDGAGELYRAVPDRLRLRRDGRAAGYHACDGRLARDAHQRGLGADPGDGRARGVDQPHSGPHPHGAGSDGHGSPEPARRRGARRGGHSWCRGHAAAQRRAAHRPAPPVGLRRAVTVRSGATRMRTGVRFVNATGTPVTGISAESTLMRITSEPPVASAVSCGATVTTQPDPIWHGPIYLTGTVTGGVAPVLLTITVSTPAYNTTPSLERIPCRVTSNGCDRPITTTGTLRVALPAASTGTVVSAIARGTPTLEIGTTTTWTWSRSSSRSVPEPMAMSGTMDSCGPRSSDPAHSAHATMPPETASMSQGRRRRIIAPTRAARPPAARRAARSCRCPPPGRTPPDPGPGPSTRRSRGSVHPSPAAPASRAARACRSGARRARDGTRRSEQGSGPGTAGARAVRPARARCRAAPEPRWSRSRGAGGGICHMHRGTGCCARRGGSTLNRPESGGRWRCASPCPTYPRRSSHTPRRRENTRGHPPDPRRRAARDQIGRAHV